MALTSSGGFGSLSPGTKTGTFPLEIFSTIVSVLVAAVSMPAVSETLLTLVASFFPGTKFELFEINNVAPTTGIKAK
jgi:hypothetical protein